MKLLTLKEFTDYIEEVYVDVESRERVRWKYSYYKKYGVLDEGELDDQWFLKGLYFSIVKNSKK